MPRTIPRGWAVASVCLLALALAPAARADEARAPGPAHQGTSKHDALARRGTGAAAPSGSFWLSTAGIALVLSAFGAISLGARKIRPAGEAGPLKVIGRTCLSPRHTVYLLRAGDRVLIVGTGGPGAPSLLGELSGSEIAATGSPHLARRVGAAT